MKKTYQQPAIDIVEVNIEKGFAQSLYQSGVDLDQFMYDSSLGEEEEDTFFK